MGAEIVLVRHGRTEWSVSGQHTGRTDSPLTEEGRAQAFELAKSTHVHGRSFGLVLASPLSRAWDTAQLAGLGGAAEVCDDLMEWDYGDVEGRTTPQVREQQPGWDLWVDGVSGGETVQDVG